MHRWSSLAIWFGMVLFLAAGMILLFYAAALLLPIILVFFAVAAVAGWLQKVRIRKTFENLKPFFDEKPTVKSGAKKTKIIDAEFEVVDEKDLKN